ncbi:MAG: hypothetical protein K1X92_12555 [Bacteroidia bacterium]|nr:hypothetical protein [Bacteroidia bacterium]
MKNRISIFLLVAGMVFGNALWAQEDKEGERDNVPPRLRNQQEDFDNGNYMFPAQKRSNWSVGIMLGSAFESSDIKAQPGYGLGLNIQKALGHTFSIRGQATGGVMSGQNYQGTRGYFSGGRSRNPWAKNYWTGGFAQPDLVYYNYRTTWYDASIQGVANLNNINFYKEQNKWNLYASAGPGFMMYHTMNDALDANGLKYDFSSVPVIAQKPTLWGFGKERKTINDAIFKVRGLNGLFGNLKKSAYESLAEGHFDEQGIPFGSYTDQNGDKQKKYWVWNPSIFASAGVLYRIGRRIELGAEHRIAWTNDDLVDGQRWQENGAKPGFGRTAHTRDFDSYHFTTLCMNVRLGKGEESMWWVNPLAEMYGSVADTRKLVKGVSEDADGDGVPDIFDQEPDTPEGTTVDTKGRTLDSDEDGVPDSYDEQKFTPKGCDVDNRGIAIDGDTDNVPDCFDQELNTDPGMYVDAKGRGIKMPEVPKFDCKECLKDLPVQPTTTQVVETACNLPSVHFDLDRTNVKQEFYPDLYQVARYMLDHPEKRILVSGYTDKGGEAVIKKRVDNVINFLVGNFGLDRSRFDIAYGATANGVTVYTGGGGSGKAPQHAPLDYMNRRVDFTCID